MREKMMEFSALVFRGEGVISRFIHKIYLIPPSLFRLLFVFLKVKREILNYSLTLELRDSISIHDLNGFIYGL